MVLLVGNVVCLLQWNVLVLFSQVGMVVGVVCDGVVVGLLILVIEGVVSGVFIECLVG